MSAIPKPPAALALDAHKGDAGRSLIVAGSASMPGAAILCVRAAQRAGAGLVTLGCFTEELLRVVPVASPETLFLNLASSRELYGGRLPVEILEHRHDVRVAGPGLGLGPRTRELAECLIEDTGFNGPLVFDADCLRVLAGRLDFVKQAAAEVVLTPHPGEAADLYGAEVPPQPEGRAEVAREIARQSGGICVLKGAGTVVSDGERSYVNGTGNPGMATAGAGDVLSGILAAYLAAVGEDVFEAVCAAVYVHGRAGDLALEQRGARGLIASDLIECLPAAQREHGVAAG